MKSNSFKIIDLVQKDFKPHIFGNSSWDFTGSRFNVYLILVILILIACCLCSCTRRCRERHEERIMQQNNGGETFQIVQNNNEILEILEQQQRLIEEQILINRSAAEPLPMGISEVQQVEAMEQQDYQPQQQYSYDYNEVAGYSVMFDGNGYEANSDIPQGKVIRASYNSPTKVAQIKDDEQIQDPYE